jgi:hypothetical protein
MQHPIRARRRQYASRSIGQVRDFDVNSTINRMNLPFAGVTAVYA